MERDAIRLEYDTFRELWKRLVSKKKARKQGVDRDTVWAQLASGALALRKGDAVPADGDAGVTAMPQTPNLGMAIEGALIERAAAPESAAREAPPAARPARKRARPSPAPVVAPSRKRAARKRG